MNAAIRLITALLLLFSAPGANAHEFWIEARDYQVAPGAPVAARLLNGQEFRGVELAWFEGRIETAYWRQGSERHDFASRTGDRPALRLVASQPGLVELVYQSTPSSLTYTNWATFEKFARVHGNGGAIARHRARGLPEQGFEERYTRYCKALVAVGDGAGADHPAGMEAELIALGNPYADAPAAPFTVEFRYQGQTVAGAVITLFDKAPDGRVTRRDLVSDGAGRVTAPRETGHRYLLNAVVLREIDDPRYSWESLWASLTYAAPL